MKLSAMIRAMTPGPTERDEQQPAMLQMTAGDRFTDVGTPASFAPALYGPPASR